MEIGAGTGTWALSLAREGFQVTVLDYSNEAIKLSRRIFKVFNIKAAFLNRNALDLTEYECKYNVILSNRLVEHFYNKDRVGY